MSTELATTQPVRRPGSPAPIGGALPPDKLGLTLRERLWLTRAALTTMVLSVIASVLILSFVPAEHVVKPPDAIAERLQRQAEQPAPAPVHAAPMEDLALPAAEVHRAAPVEVEPAPAPPAVKAEASKPQPQPQPKQRGVQIIRNQKSKEVATWPVVEEAVRIDVPQPLAPKKVEYIDHPKPEPAPAPAPKAAPKPEPVPDDEGLKRPSFE